MKTDICKTLGIDVPIFAFTHCRDVVVEVSKAGGMGVLGCAGFTPEQLEQELNWIQEKVGDKPFGIDVIGPANLDDHIARRRRGFLCNGRRVEVRQQQDDDHHEAQQGEQDDVTEDGGVVLAVKRFHIVHGLPPVQSVRWRA